MHIKPIIAVLLIYLCNSCGTDGNLVYSDDVELTNYYQMFVNAGGRSTLYRLDLVYADLPNGTLGECVISPASIRAVRLSKVMWPLLTKVEKEIVMFHELGHCILNRMHDNRRSAYREYESIMNYRPLLTAGDYEKKREDYLKELFK